MKAKFILISATLLMGCRGGESQKEQSDSSKESQATPSEQVDESASSQAIVSDSTIVATDSTVVDEIGKNEECPNMLKVKAVEAMFSMSNKGVSSSIEIDYPVSSDQALNRRIATFLLDKLPEIGDWIADFEDGVKKKPSRKPKRIDESSIRDYMNEYVVAYCKSLSDDGFYSKDRLYAQSYTLKLQGQGKDYVSYRWNIATINVGICFYYDQFFIVRKSDGKRIGQIFKDKKLNKAYEILYADEDWKSIIDIPVTGIDTKTMKEDVLKALQNPDNFWLDDDYLHFSWLFTMHFGSQFDFPIEKVRPYLTDELKALLE